MEERLALQPQGVIEMECRTFLQAARSGVNLEEVDKVNRVVSQVADIGGVASPLQQQQVIKCLHKDATSSALSSCHC